MFCRKTKYSVRRRKYKHDIIKSTVLYPDQTGKKERNLKSYMSNRIVSCKLILLKNNKLTIKIMKKEEKDLAFEELEDRLEMAQIAAADVTRCSIGCEK